MTFIGRKVPSCRLQTLVARFSSFIDVLTTFTAPLRRFVLSVKGEMIHDSIKHLKSFDDERIVVCIPRTRKKAYVGWWNNVGRFSNFVQIFGIILSPVARLMKLLKLQN